MKMRSQKINFKPLPNLNIGRHYDGNQKSYVSAESDNGLNNEEGDFFEKSDKIYIGDKIDSLITSKLDHEKYDEVIEDSKPYEDIDKLVDHLLISKMQDKTDTEL